MAGEVAVMAEKKQKKQKEKKTGHFVVTIVMNVEDGQAKVRSISEPLKSRKTTHSFGPLLSGEYCKSYWMLKPCKASRNERI